MPPRLVPRRNVAQESIDRSVERRVKEAVAREATGASVRERVRQAARPEIDKVVKPTVAAVAQTAPVPAVLLSPAAVIAQRQVAVRGQPYGDAFVDGLSGVISPRKTNVQTFSMIEGALASNDLVRIKLAVSQVTRVLLPLYLRKRLLALPGDPVRVGIGYPNNTEFRLPTAAQRELRNPALSSFRLVQLAEETTDPDTLSLVAGHPNASVDLLEKIAAIPLGRTVTKPTLQPQLLAQARLVSEKNAAVYASTAPLEGTPKETTLSAAERTLLAQARDGSIIETLRAAPLGASASADEVASFEANALLTVTLGDGPAIQEVLRCFSRAQRRVPLDIRLAIAQSLRTDPGNLLLLVNEGLPDTAAIEAAERLRRLGIVVLVPQQVGDAANNARLFALDLERSERADSSVQNLLAVVRNPRVTQSLLLKLSQNPDAQVAALAKSRLLARRLLLADLTTPSAPAALPDGARITLPKGASSFFREAEKTLIVDKSRVDESSPAYKTMTERLARGEPGGLNGRVEEAPRSPVLAALKRGHAGAFYAELQSDPRFRKLVNEYNDYFRTLSPTVGAGLAQDLFESLQKADPVAFTTLLERMELDAVEASTRLKSAIESAQTKGVMPYYPTVIIGSGPQGASIAQEWKRVDPRAGLLMIEAANRPGGQFVGQGSQFRLNSRSGQARPGEVPAFGSDVDLNPIAGPVQAASGGRYAVADSLANAARAAAMTSGADLLLGTRIVAVFDARQDRAVNKAPGNYILFLANGDRIYTDQLVVAGGIGKDKFPFDDKTNALIEEERSKIDLKKAQAMPGIVTVSDLFSIMEASPSGRDAFRPKNGKRIETLYVGSGDSTKTAIEGVYGFGPESAYTGDGRVDYTQRGGDVGTGLWLTGMNGFDSCAEYISGNADTKGRRPRYAGIESLLTPGAGNAPPKVQPKRGVVQAIERITSGEDSGRFRVTYQDAFARIQTKVVDRVVLGTGKDSGVESVLAPVLSNIGGTSLRDKVVEVKGTPDGYKDGSGNGRSVAVASQVRGQSIFIAGPTLPVEPRAENLSSDQRAALEKAGENVVGLAYNTPRNVIFARQAAEAQKQDPSKQSAFISAPASVRVQAAVDKNGKRSSTLGTADVAAPARMVGNTLDGVRLGSVLRLALAQLSLSSVPAGSKVRVWAETKPGTRDVVLRVAGLDAAGCDAISAAFTADPWVQQYLGAQVTAAARALTAQTVLALETEIISNTEKSATPMQIKQLRKDPRSSEWKAFQLALE